MYIMDKASSLPLYMQLYTQIKIRIMSGDLPAGCKLPSVRNLSDDLCISKNTVLNTYDLLQAEGFILNKPGSGYYINTLTLNTPPAFTNQYLVENLICEGYDNLVPLKPFKYDFSLGSRIPEDLPFTEWEKLINKCLRDYRYEMSTYRKTGGEPRLREEIQKYLKNYRDVYCTADQIIISPGIYDSVTMLSRLIREEGHFDVAMGIPGAIADQEAFLLHGATIHLISVNTWGIDVDELKASPAKAVYVMPTHQFPTGAIMPVSRRLELIEWARSRDALIIEHNSIDPFRYDGKPVPTLQSLAPDKVIYVGSFSETLFPFLRTAFVVLPQKLAAKYQEYFSRQTCSVSFLTQKTLELFIKEGYMEAHVRQFRRKLKQRHDCLVERLKKEFADAITICGVNAGFELTVQANWPVTEKELVAKAYEAGIGITPGSLFCYFPGNMPGHLIPLSFCGINLENIPDGVRLLRKAWLN